MSTTTKTKKAAKSAARKKPATRPPSDRNQGRKTLDPEGEVMAKRNIRATDAQWSTQRRRGHEVWREWLGLSESEFATYRDWYARTIRKRERDAA
jgi:hypothetical protein